ncbi:hypothetical protein ACQKWADRAFT_293666 [Trichoderma austrokoningii]
MERACGRFLLGNSARGTSCNAASARPITSRIRRRAPMSLSVDLVFSAWSHQEPPRPFIFNGEACSTLGAPPPRALC